MKSIITQTDEAQNLIRLRDSIYATDLLITAITKLDFFSWLSDRKVSINEIITHFQLKKRPTAVMLDYFKALKLIVQEQEAIINTDKSMRFLTQNSKTSLVPYFRTQSNRPIVKKMLNALKSGTPQNWGASTNDETWEKAMLNEDFAIDYTEGMDSRGALYAPILAKVFDFSGYKAILDIAAGSGIYTKIIKSVYPGIKATILEKAPASQIVANRLRLEVASNQIDIIERE
ncbi:MAG: methyltransferase [Prolixibacteraceae bacterium]